MRRDSTTKIFLNGALALVSLLSTATYASGPQLQTLYRFAGGTDGVRPQANLVSDAAGNLYGTTVNGGSNAGCLGGTEVGCGVVFELSPPSKRGGAWKENVLYRFSGDDGAFPVAGLIRDQAGNLYGTTAQGGTFDGVCVNGKIDLGCGVVFELSPELGGIWSETVLYAFTGLSDGGYPAANLTFDVSGNLYGTTQGGGIGLGTIFELSPNGSQGWTETVLYEFQGDPDGAFPLAGLVFDQLGNLYGTTSVGGVNGAGTVYELLPPGTQGGNWTEDILSSFTASAGVPYGGVIFDKAGNLYGTTSGPKGSVFELTPTGDSWSESTLYAFGSTRISMPLAGLLTDNLGNLYGTATGDFCGGGFRLQNHSGSWKEAELDFFTGHNGPCGPEAALIFGKNDAIYGTSVVGGGCHALANGCGTVFGAIP